MAGDEDDRVLREGDEGHDLDALAPHPVLEAALGDRRGSTDIDHDQRDEGAEAQPADVGGGGDPADALSDGHQRVSPTRRGCA